MIESGKNLSIVDINDDDKGNNKNIVYKQGKWKLNNSNKYIFRGYVSCMDYGTLGII